MSSTDERRTAAVVPGLLPAGTPVDLDTCDREPIHVPGSVQPHGVLLTVADPDHRVHQVSDNCATLLGRSAQEVLGRPLADLLDPAPVAALTGVMQGERATSLGAPLLVTSPVDGAPLDALVHRSGAVWVVELERQPEEAALAATLAQVRSVVTALGGTASVEQLLQRTVTDIRLLSGFDRVMVYRFDPDWNGEVVAEARREDLGSYLGLHYPASDIPAQARALYTRNWLRFIRDVDAVDAPLVPRDDPVGGEPLDLSLAALRSVSPIHCQYLRNMGVTASMSVSLVIDGTLAGLIACHHYSGPYVPGALVRASCEFLAQTVSALLAERERQERAARREDARQALQTVLDRSGATADLGLVLEQQATELMAMVGATGMAWTLDGRTHTAGAVPRAVELARVRRWAQRRVGPDGLSHTDRLAVEEPALTRVAETASGVLLLQLAPDQDVLFVRPEAVQAVDWGGNPHLKVLSVDDEGVSRLSPRGSFALWRETLQHRSAAWGDVEREAALLLRGRMVQALYEQGRALAGVAETLQRSLLPERLPQVPGWTVAAEYDPASVAVGGDWYDVLTLPSGRLLLVVGDVAGHGLGAAGAMAQLRNALRAYAVEDDEPVTVLTRLDALVAALAPDQMATAVVVRLDPASGEVHAASAGHPPPMLLPATGGHRALEVQTRPPLGAGGLAAASPRPAPTGVMMGAGDALLLVSDGMFKRRDEAVDESLGALGGRAADALASGGDVTATVRALLAWARPPASTDDATLLMLRRR